MKSQLINANEGNERLPTILNLWVSKLQYYTTVMHTAKAFLVIKMRSVVDTKFQRKILSTSSAQCPLITLAIHPYSYYNSKMAERIFIRVCMDVMPNSYSSVN